MKGSEDLPRLFRENADWWPVLSSPEDYAEEADFYRSILLTGCTILPKTMLELGSGGGNNASHLKKYFRMTLVDLSLGMLKVSKDLNPECRHIQGDMRTIRLRCQFDLVFIHDAIVYMTSMEDIRCAITTAFEHCKPGGAALFVPDHTRETFKPITTHGGHDKGRRSMRYLEWTWDPDPDDTTYLNYRVCVLRDGSNEVHCVQDLDKFGLFSHNDWLRVISDVGFQAQSYSFDHKEAEKGSNYVFLGRKPDDKYKVG